MKSVGRWISCSRKWRFLGVVLLVQGLMLFGYLAQQQVQYEIKRSIPKSMDLPMYPNCITESPLATSSLTTEKLRMKGRLDNVRKQCLKYGTQTKWTNMPMSGSLWTHAARNISYCVTPKVGCTFWKRVFRFLNHDYPGVVRSPADINRMFVHYGGLKNTKVVSAMNQVMRNLLGSQNAFLFARDPYTRLWSAYIDKFFLPDFWRTQAKNIVRVVRVNSTLTERMCPKSVSFDEFLRFVLFVDHNNGTMNEHFIPIYKLCNPCLMNFNAIGKQETFSADTAYIMKQYDIEFVMQNSSSKNRVEDELNMLIDYNFALEKHIIVANCYKRVEVAERLWTAFQINGYISSQSPFPEYAFISQNSTKDAFKKLAFSTYLQHQNDPSLKSQRRETLVKAYSTVSRAVLEQLVEIYKPDFELFEYDPRPSDIFT